MKIKSSGKKKHYIYHLIDPTTNIVFYVGKGTSGRMYDHENLVIKDKIPHGNKHLFYKIKQIITSGNRVIYKKILENLDNKLACEFEIQEIKNQRKLNENLCNIGIGGEGGDNISNHPNKDVIIEKFRILNKMMVDKYVRGIPKSDEARRRMSMVIKTPEWRKKISISKTGHKTGIPSYMKDPIKKKLWMDKISKNHADFSGNKNPFFRKTHSSEIKDSMSKNRRKIYKLTYDGNQIIIEGGKILKCFIEDYNKIHNTNYNVPMIKYKRNSIGWRLERI
jgi:hypothetical protein